MAKRILVVGGVAGGAACAARLRRNDEQAEIFLYERGPDVSFANCGLPYYLGNVIAKRSQLLVATPERFRDWLNVEVRVRHEVRRIDRTNRTVEIVNVNTKETSQAGYDALVLSTGAAPIRPDLPGIDLPGVFSLRNLDDADRIQTFLRQQRNGRRAVIVGGGYIGLEMAENLHRRGLEVTLLEMTSQVMPPMDPEMVAPIHAELRNNGVELRLGAAMTGIETVGDELCVLTKDGGRLPADMVLLAIGVRPEVHLARDAGLEIGTTGGIHVDAQMRTSDPAIYAVGDAIEVMDLVTGQPTLVPLAGPAARQGRVAADAICGLPAAFHGVLGTGVVGAFGMTLAMTGASEKKLRKLGMPFDKVYTHSFHHASYYPNAEMISLKLLYRPNDGRLLGAQAVGKAGVDKRIDVLATAILKGATIYDLEELELCYAPQYGSAKDPVNIAGFVAGNILRGVVDSAHWSDWLAMKDDGKKPLVVDVRTRQEAAAKSVPGTVNIPLDELRKRLDELPRDKEIWVHCGVGQRAYYACRILKQNGFRARNLSGGLKTYLGMMPDSG